MTSLIAAIALVFAGVALLALNAKKRCQSVPSVFATAFRSFARIGQGEANARLVFLVATVIGLASFQSAHAQSSGCAAINSAWGGGRSFTGGSEFYQDGLTILAGEQLTYTVTTSGTGNPNSAGFAIYQNDGTAPGDILLEQYASPGAELSLSNTITLPEDDDRFIVYAWSDVGGGTVQATVTCSGKTDQTITFTNPGAQTFGTTPTLTASASSGLTPVLTSATTGVCTIDSAKVLTFVTTGTCTINANQAGNSSYNAAPQVQQSFTVNPAPPIAGAVSLTVAAYSSANPVTLNLSGGTATSVAIAEAASHGTAVASGTSITYTPTSGYSGSDSFTYTAENSGGTSSPATVSVTVSAPPQLSINDVSQLEDDSGTTTFTFTVSLDKPAGTSGVSFDIATANGTASASSDYDAKSLTSQTIPAGSSSAVFSVTVNGDTTFEADETFFVNVTNVLNATNADSQGLGSILNDDLATPTVLVSTSDSNPTRGTSVSFTATMAGGSSPTGTVTFKDGSTTLGTGTISGTAATFSTAALAVGSHSITAVYGGDTSNAGATSSAITVAVAQVSPTLTVSAADSSPALGASVTFTATLAGGLSPTGTVTFKDGSTTLGTGMVSGTTATLSTAALAVGAHSITAVYGGDTDNAAATASAITITVAQLTPTVSVSASDSNPALGASVTLTATLSGGSSPTGTVTFKDGSTTLGTGTISGATATLSTAALAVGAHTITAVYGGDTDNTDATSSAITVTVGQLSPTVSVSTSDSNPTRGTSVTFTATMAGGSSPTGTVTFKDGSTTLGTGMISGTTATFSTADLTVGSHSITAVYGGDTSNAGATSSAITVAVAQVSPTLTVSASDSSPALGASVTFTATLAGGSSPTGTVTFKDGSATLGTGTISGTTATFSTAALAVGTHTIAAVYGGDTDNTDATSSSITVTVGQLSPTVTVSASDSSPALGASVTFTATLSGGLSPTGTVTFKNGATTLGTGTISGTTATFSTAALAVGAHSVIAVYDGDTNNAAATSSATTVTVAQRSPTVTVSASDTTPALGVSVTFTATLSGGSSPTGTVTFKNGATTLGTGTISGTTATFSTAALAVGAHSVIAVYGGDTNNAIATSSAITVTVGQLSPTLTISVSDTSPALGASVTFTATLEGGSSPTGTVTFKEGSTTLSTGKVSSGNVMFSTTSLKVGVHSIRAEYAGDVNNAAAASAALRIKVGKLAPTVTVIASDSSPAFGASVTFTATLSGGSSPAGVVTFKDGSTTLGTGTVSSGKATFSTTAFGVGTHSITAAYAGDMNNAAATSAAVSIKVGKLSPTVAVSASNTNPALGASVRFTATLAGGSSPTGIITFKNGSTTLGTGSVSGTTATFSTATLKVGAHSIRAEYAGDTNHAAAASAAITVTVKASVMVFTPTGGALAEAMVGEAYSQRISAKGGVGALTYRLKTGALPAGVVLNISTGELTGPLSTAAKAKSYSFVIEAKDGFSTTGTASYTLPVKPRAVTVTDKTIDVPPGSAPVNVNLEAGATGGPFVSADPTFVEPATAGTASIVRGEFAAAGSTSLGWYLKFIPNPAFSGTAKVGFKLTSVLGVSNTGTVSYKISYDAAKVSEDIDALVHGFIRTRQGLIASAIKVPGLLERRQLEDAIDPVTARMTPSEDGMTASFSTSLAQMEAARNSADGVAGGSALPLNVWLDGVLMAHKRDENDGKWGSFAMLNVGADYLISEKALIGLSFHLDRMTDPSNVDAELSGNGWLAGPYASFEIGKGVFWDTSLRYGGSSNDIDTAFWDGSFDTQRWMIDTAIRGEWQIGEATVLTPKLRAIYFNETVDDYTVRNDGGDELDIDGFDAEQFRVSLGAEIARSFTLESGAKVTPKLGVTAGYAGIDGPGIYGSLTAGVTMQTPDFWMLEASLLLNIENDGQKSVGATVRAGKQF